MLCDHGILLTLRLHPLHGGPSQRRPVGPLAEAVVDAVDTLSHTEPDSLEDDVHVNFSRQAFDIHTDDEAASTSIPLLFSEVSRGVNPRHLLLKRPSEKMEETSISTDADSFQVEDSEEAYVCHQCLRRGIRGPRCWFAASSSSAKGSIRCPTCVPRSGTMDTWVFILPDDTESTALQVLAAVGEAGATRTDLCASFQLLPREIGRGSQAIAYRAIPKVSMFKEGSYTGCCGSDCDESGVIVKCFTPDKTQDTSKDIMREVEMLATVQRHPNVVSFCGFFRAEDADIHAMPNSSRYALMMNFCSGGDLSDIVSKGRCDFTEEDAAQKISGLLSALVHIHSRDIVHRDVKSENILFDWDGRPILADFGLACFSTDSEQMIRRCGSAGYCAPEVIMGQPYDAKVDVFGAGVVLYILLQHGHRPFRGRDVHSVLHRTVRCHVAFDRNGDCQALSDGCRRYILQLLSKKPRDRPSSSEALFQMEKNMFPDCRNDSRCLTASTTASTCGVLSAACASSSVSQSSSQAPSSSLIERSSQRSTSRSETETIAEDSVVMLASGCPQPRVPAPIQPSTLKRCFKRQAQQIMKREPAPCLQQEALLASSSRLDQLATASSSTTSQGGDSHEAARLTNNSVASTGRDSTGRSTGRDSVTSETDCSDVFSSEPTTPLGTLDVVMFELPTHTCNPRSAPVSAGRSWSRRTTRFRRKIADVAAALASSAPQTETSAPACQDTPDYLSQEGEVYDYVSQETMLRIRSKQSGGVPTPTSSCSVGTSSYRTSSHSTTGEHQRQADRVDSCSHPTPLVPVSPSTPQGSGTPSKRQGGKKFFFTRLCRLSQQPTTEGEPSVMPVLKQTDQEEMLLEDTPAPEPAAKPATRFAGFATRRRNSQ